MAKRKIKNYKQSDHRKAKKADKKYLKLMGINIPVFRKEASKVGNKKRANWLQ